MSKAKEFDIKPFQIWNVHGKFKQPDETVLENMTVLAMSTLEKGTVNKIIVMGLFKEKNENFKFWECLDIGLEERYLAGDCIYSTFPDSIQGDMPRYEITDESTKRKIKELYDHNFN